MLYLWHLFLACANRDLRQDILLVYVSRDELKDDLFHFFCSLWLSLLPCIALLCCFTLLQVIEPGQLLQAVIEGKEASLTLCLFLQCGFLFHTKCTCLHGREGFS